MSAEADYLRGERDNLRETVRLVEELLAKQERSLYETIAKKYIVTLTEEERQRLQEMLSRGKAAARKLTHAWEKSRDQAEVKVNWQFTTADARIKLKRLYPSTEE